MKDIHADTLIALAIFVAGAALGSCAIRSMAETGHEVGRAVPVDLASSTGIRDLGAVTPSVDGTRVDPEGIVMLAEGRTMESVCAGDGSDAWFGIDDHDGRLAIDGYGLSVDCPRVDCHARQSAVVACCEPERNDQCQY